MTLYEELLPKQKRSIRSDIDLIFSLKGISSPKTFDEMKVLGIFPPRVRVKDRDFYFSKKGQVALRRICDFIHSTKSYNDLLSYNDVFQGVIAELGRWFNDELIPDDREFIEPLHLLLLNRIDNFRFFCRVDGISIDNILGVNIGKYEVKKYDEIIISWLNDPDDGDNKFITKDYKDSLVITGSERGSFSVAKEKFYHNADLSLSIIRLYSCALFNAAIRKINIHLINNCAQAYGPASSFCWKDLQKNLIITRHFRSTQDMKINSELLNDIQSNFFFEMLSSLIGKEQNNEVANAILKALFWIGEAQKDRSNASSWIKLWSSMECFFTLGDKEITEHNARGISSILIYGGYSHEEFENYPQLKQKIKNFYKLRSKTVHRAEYTHIDERILVEFSFIAAWTVITMASLLSRGYTTLSQIKKQADRLDELAGR